MLPTFFANLYGYFVTCQKTSRLRNFHLEKSILRAEEVQHREPVIDQAVINQSIIPEESGFLKVEPAGWMGDWLAGWLAGLLTGSLTGCRLAGWLTDLLTDLLTGWLADRLACCLAAGWLAGRLADRLINWLAGHNWLVRTDFSH